MLRVVEKLRKFDAYPKLHLDLEDFSVRTVGGAIVSIVSVTVMVVLFWVEFVNYLTPDISEELFVDTTRSPKLQINLDIIVPTISCDFLALDAMDTSGEQHLQIEHNIYKRRLDLTGDPIEDPKKEDITLKSKVVEVKNETECGSCYGAALDPKRCCNTCEDVREAYRERRWAFPDNPENISQCKDEHFAEKLKNAFAEGCQVYGSLIVNRVGGSFHIAPGKSFSINHVHVHDVQPFSSSSFNTTHKIRMLTFGPSIDSATHNPLEDHLAVAEEGATMFQYHIKIVPTAHQSRNGSIIHTNQFSVTNHKKVVSILNGESGMPGVFFQYELSPLMVKYTERERSFGHFLTNVCAIIGGVYTVAGLVDSLLYNSVRMIRKKIEMGKFH